MLEAREMVISARTLPEVLAVIAVVVRNGA